MSSKSVFESCWIHVLCESLVKEQERQSTAAQSSLVQSEVLESLRSIAAESVATTRKALRGA